MGGLLVKTPQGQKAFKERHAQLAGKLRSAFLLFDGQRTVHEVLQATQGMGISQKDIDSLLQAGWLQVAELTKPDLAPAGMAVTRTAQERYRDAYPLAVALSGNLGLSGFRLNLQVEAATNYEELLGVASKIKEAVGPKAYAPLEKALFA